MEAPKFSSFRVLISRNIATSSTFYQISDLEFFDGAGGEGQNILTGGVASASSSFGGGWEPDKAFDGLPDTGWSSAASPALPIWIRYDLQEPVAARSFRLRTSAAGDGPADFIVQGSNDAGLTWLDIFAFENFATAQQMAVGKIANLSAYGVGGTAHLDSGAPANSVIVYEWATGELLARVPVSTEGQWAVPVQSPDVALMVVVQGPAGTRPQAHGPLMAEAYQ